MKPASLAAVVPLMLATGGVQAQTACVYPQAPQTFPDGATAPKEDMVAGQATVKAYASSVQETYLPCLEKEKVDSIAKLDTADEAYAQKKLALEEIHAKKTSCRQWRIAGRKRSPNFGLATRRSSPGGPLERVSPG
jgi:hypothetical protein